MWTVEDQVRVRGSGKRSKCSDKDSTDLSTYNDRRGIELAGNRGDQQQIRRGNSYTG